MEINDKYVNNIKNTGLLIKIFPNCIKKTLPVSGNQQKLY